MYMVLFLLLSARAFRGMNQRRERSILIQLVRSSAARRAFEGRIASPVGFCANDKSLDMDETIATRFFPRYGWFLRAFFQAVHRRRQATKRRKPSRTQTCHLLGISGLVSLKDVPFSVEIAVAPHLYFSTKPQSRAGRTYTRN